MSEIPKPGYLITWLKCRILPQYRHVVLKSPIVQPGALSNSPFQRIYCLDSNFQTTSKGKSYFEAYKEYQKWEDFVDKVKQNLTNYYPESPVIDMFQTSDFWPEVGITVMMLSFLPDRSGQTV